MALPIIKSWHTLPQQQLVLNGATKSKAAQVAGGIPSTALWAWRTGKELNSTAQRNMLAGKGRVKDAAILRTIKMGLMRSKQGGGGKGGRSAKFRLAKSYLIALHF